MASRKNTKNSRRAAPQTSPELSDEARFGVAGQGRIRDAELRFDNIEKGMEYFFQRYAESEKQRNQMLTIRKKQHKRETKLTAQAIRRAQGRSHIETIVRASRGRGSIDNRPVSPHDQPQDFNPVSAIQDFAPFFNHLPPELLQEIPLTPFVYSLRQMYMPPYVHNSISTKIIDHDARNREYQELMHSYLHVSADRLADISPCYMDIWRSYIPSMAFSEAGSSLGLLSALVALAALHIAPLQADRDRGKERSYIHYGTAISYLQQSENLFAPEIDDAVLATALVLAHYELWDGEITKMGIHMLASKAMILLRGKEASRTPLGRALFAFYLRTDCGSSVVTGNPVFLDESWWKVDPLYDMVIPQDAPILLAADAATAKICVIIAKLTDLKSSAQKRRKKLVLKIQGNQCKNPEGQSKRLEDRIRRHVQEMQRELEVWHRSLPAWFCAVNVDQMEDGEEDINQTTILEPRSEHYPHFSVAVVLTSAFAANIQLWRVANPDEQIPPPRIGALVHALLRAFLACPPTTDSMTIGNVWIAAGLLRQKHHRDWLENKIRARILRTDFFGWKFAYHGILFQWALVDGTQEGRFKSVPAGAQETSPGVSQNLWRADGIMNTESSHLTEEEKVMSPEGQKPMYRYEGDAKLFDNDEDDEAGEESGDKTEPGSADVGKRIPLYSSSSFLDDY